ncbi:MAG: 4-alpha-glucanotransferase, partial [Myxococcota bacterium]
LIDEEKARGERDMRGWQRRAIREWLMARGLLDHGLEPESDEETFAVLRGLLLSLASSEAESLLVTLEDLWLEKEPQNVPGTYLQHPNWQRRMKRPVEDIVSMERVLTLLKDIEDRRGRQES